MSDSFCKDGGQRRIRTFVHLREQIYSLPPLTTRPSTHRRKFQALANLRLAPLSRRRFSRPCLVLLQVKNNSF